MLGHALGRRWVRWTVPLALAAAVGAVLVATLASPNKASADVVIAGARSISDHVSIAYGVKKKGTTTDVHLLAFNDLHGNLEAGRATTSTATSPAAPPTSRRRSRIARRSTATSEATVFAGDNIGASPLANGLFFEEPITVATNLMNVDFASVGNHEFDKGSDELLRIQNGGCRPVEGCTGCSVRAPGRRRPRTSIPGPTSSTWPPTSIVDATGETLFPRVRRSRQFKTDHGGKKLEVGFIGEVLESTPTIVTPTGVAGLTFQDEADAANAVRSSTRTRRTSTRGCS